MSVELYTAAGCQYSQAAREDLEWRGIEFVEYDVEKDEEARKRMIEITGTRTVPVIVEEGKPPRVGWMGQGCFI